MTSISLCPACASTNLLPFFQLTGVPVHSMLLLADQHEALDFPRGDIDLALCQHCGFITNMAFDPAMMAYSPNYESSQAFSPRFNAFARELAARLVEQYQLQGKSILEIGCGGGDFLALLCQAGAGHAVGIDPAAGVGREDLQNSGQIEFIQEYYSEHHAPHIGSMALCRHTLEHIWDTGNFVTTLRRSLGERHDVPVVFELPDVTRVLHGVAFWDIYYEHCSYFCAGSLARLFAQNEFDVTRVSSVFDDQYLLLEAYPSSRAQPQPSHLPDYLEQLRQDIDHFAHSYPVRLETWRNEIRQAAGQGRRCIVWGGGSKGVAFLNTLGLGDEVDYVVDINPLKQNMYVAGTGHLIAGPEHLKQRPPDLILVMNPIYYGEIRQMAQDTGVNARLVTV